MRADEFEIREIENEIRGIYPAAAFIELEPDSKDFKKYAIDENSDKMRNREIMALERLLQAMTVR